MRRWVAAIVVALMGVTSVAVAVEGEAARGQTDRGYREGHIPRYRTVVIRWSPQGPAPDFAGLETQIRSSIVPEAAKAAKIPEELMNKHPLLVKPEEPKDDSFRLTVSVDDWGDQAAAERWLDAVVEGINKYVSTSFTRQWEHQRMMVEDELARARADVRDAEDSLRQLQEKLRNQTGRVEVSPQSLRSWAAKLDDERQALELETESRRVRWEALKETLADQMEKAKKDMGSDAVLAELEKVVQVKMKELEHTQGLYKSGLASMAQLSAVEASLAEARARLVTRKQEVASAGTVGETLAAMNRELLNVSVEMKEKDFKLKLVSERLNKLREVIVLVDDSERTEQKLTGLRKELEAARAETLSAQRARWSVPRPSVFSQPWPSPTTQP